MDYNKRYKIMYLKTILFNLKAMLLIVLISCQPKEKEGLVELKVKENDISIVKNFNSIGDAIHASRQYNENSAKTIVLGNGDYYLPETIRLDSGDAGLTIEGESQKEVKIYAGRKITNWKKGESDFWVAKLPEVQKGKWFFRSLLVNGRFADRARYPEKGRLYHDTKFNGIWMSTAQGGWKDEPTETELTQMKFKKEDIGVDFEKENAELTIMHHWDETLVGVKSIDFQNLTLTTSLKTGHPIGSWNTYEYVIWNTSPGMTKSGQWFLDKVNGQLVYWPLPNEDIKTIEVVAPVHENAIRIENTKNITIKNISVSSTNTSMIVGSFGAKLFDGAVSLKNSNHCKFNNLHISGATGWGLKLFGDDITVEDCHVHDVGAGAIYVIGSNAIIKNNYIHHVGKIYFSSIALYAGVTDPNVKEEWEFGKNKKNVIISHNEIHDGPYVGIGIGGSDNIIEYNKVARVMQELADGSGLYATFCKNLVMRGNCISDLTPGPHGKVSAYYLDELTDSSLVENNISFGIEVPSHNHMTKDNMIRNNIFINDGPMVITLPRCERTTFINNVFVSTTSVSFAHKKNGIAAMGGNLFDVPEGQVYESTFENEYKKGSEAKLALGKDNRISNAGIILEGTKVLFEPSSVALKMGIKPLQNKVGILIGESIGL